MDGPTLIRPVASLVGWTFFMEAWMYKGRIPILSKMTLPNTTTKETMNKHIPPIVRFKADNYDHLHEAPTRFYAITLALALLEATSLKSADLAIESKLAWGYVGFRVAHSLVQALGNRIPLRFAVYGLSEFTMLGLFGRLVYRLLQ